MSGSSWHSKSPASPVYSSPASPAPLFRQVPSMYPLATGGHVANILLPQQDVYNVVCGVLESYGFATVSAAADGLEAAVFLPEDFLVCIVNFFTRQDGSVVEVSKRQGSSAIAARLCQQLEASLRPGERDSENGSGSSSGEDSAGSGASATATMATKSPVGPDAYNVGPATLRPLIRARLRVPSSLLTPTASLKNRTQDWVLPIQFATSELASVRQQGVAMICRSAATMNMTEFPQVLDVLVDALVPEVSGMETVANAAHALFIVASARADGGPEAVAAALRRRCCLAHRFVLLDPSNCVAVCAGRSLLGILATLCEARLAASADEDVQEVLAFLAPLDLLTLFQRAQRVSTDARTQEFARRGRWATLAGVRKASVVPASSSPTFGTFAPLTAVPEATSRETVYPQPPLSSALTLSALHVKVCATQTLERVDRIVRGVLAAAGAVFTYNSATFTYVAQVWCAHGNARMKVRVLRSHESTHMEVEPEPGCLPSHPEYLVEVTKCQGSSILIGKLFWEVSDAIKTDCAVPVIRPLVPAPPPLAPAYVESAKQCVGTQAIHIRSRLSGVTTALGALEEATMTAAALMADSLASPFVATEPMLRALAGVLDPARSAHSGCRTAAMLALLMALDVSTALPALRAVFCGGDDAAAIPTVSLQYVVDSLSSIRLSPESWLNVGHLFRYGLRFLAGLVRCGVVCPTSLDAAFGVDIARFLGVELGEGDSPFTVIVDLELETAKSSLHSVLSGLA